MSGGALNYLYNQVEEAALKVTAHYGQASDLGERKFSPAGVAFGQLLFQVSKALRDIEYDMSGDGSDWANVFRLIGPCEEAKAVADQLRVMISEAENVLKKLNK